MGLVLDTVRVAAVQATPVILDGPATAEKAARLLHQAADGGAKLVVLPETFIPLYPSNRWAKGASGFSGWDALWERLWANSVDVPGPLLDPLITICKERGLHCVLGVNEREAARPGTLYNTMVTLGPGGVLAKHRKLMPTHHERLFHGQGRGDDLSAVDTPVGRVGGLICWENRMPQARYRVYQSGPQIWCAPTADDDESWIASMRHLAIESGAFVISVPQLIPRSAFPADFPVPVPDAPETFGRGGACVVEPRQGALIAGPLYDREEILFADCDLREGLRAKRVFDVVGHYSRGELFD